MSDTPKPETPITAHPVDKTQVESTTAEQTKTETTHTHPPKKDGFQDAIDDVVKILKDAFKKINERQLVMKNRQNSTVFRLPLVWAIVLGIVSIAIWVVPIVVIGVIVALVTKHQFVIEHNVKTPSV